MSGVIVQTGDVLRHRLDPHRLPDAGGRRVPDAIWLADLLPAAARVVGWVLTRNDKLLLAARLSASVMSNENGS